MHAPHRLADPITVILSFAASTPLDLRRLTLIEPRLPAMATGATPAMPSAPASYSNEQRH